MRDVKNKSWRVLSVFMGLLVLLAMATTAQAREAQSNAYGLLVEADAEVAVSGVSALTDNTTLGPLFEVNEGPTSDPYQASSSDTNVTASAGTLLSIDAVADLTASTEHLPLEHRVEADAEVEGLDVDVDLDFGDIALIGSTLNDLIPTLVSVSNTTLNSFAEVTGTCGAFDTDGGAEIESLELEILGQTIDVSALVGVALDPDTEVLGIDVLAGLSIPGLDVDNSSVSVTLVANEHPIQPPDPASIEVNALHLNVEIHLELTVSGLPVVIDSDVEIIIAHSQAAFLNCTDVTLAVDKITDLDDDTATVGEPFSYTVTIDGDEVNEATAVEFTDQLPAEVDFVAFGAITGGGECNYDGDSHTIICQWLAIPAGDSVSATYQVMPHTATAPDTTSNAVTVTTADNNDGEDSASVEVTINPTTNVANLAIGKEVSATEVTVGDEFSYTLTVTNLGPDTAILVVVTDTLPAEVEFVSATPEGVCTETAGVVSCELGNLADQEVAIIELTVLAVSAGTASNTATVEAASEDEFPDNNTAGPVDTTIRPNLSVELDGLTTGVVGDPAEYTATVTNHGGEAVVDVELLIEIPDGMSLDPDSVNASGGGSCTIASITCNWGSIAGDGSVVVTFTLIPNTAGPQLLAATVGTAADGDLGSDQLQILVTLRADGAPQAIPTLSEYGLMLMLALMALFMLRTRPGMRRR